MVQNEKYWFKRRRYGWGWTPVRWQGWLTLVAFLAVAIATPFVVFPPSPQDPTTGQMAVFFGVLVLDIAALVWIAMTKGPTPRWRWGKRSDDNPHEDL